MRRKIDRIIKNITETLKDWNTVDSILLIENTEGDVLDPYFALSFDVYYSGEIPNTNERAKLFGSPIVFESRDFPPKDRLLIDDLPVRIEYKDLLAIEDLIANPEALLSYVKDAGSLLAFRLEHGILQYDKGERVHELRKRLRNLPDSFWNSARDATIARMEHYLNDLGASVMRSDAFFYLISQSGFLKYASASIFLSNHIFEPSHRLVSELLFRLPSLPTEFQGRWETLLRQDESLSPERKYQIALLIASSISSFTS